MLGNLKPAFAGEKEMQHMKKKRREWSGGKAPFLLLPESLAMARNVLLVPAHSRTAHLPELLSLRHRGGCGVMCGVQGEVCSEISSPTSTLSIIYLNPSILPNPSHFPWLSQPRFHSQDTAENMFDLFLFLLAAT